MQKYGKWLSRKHTSCSTGDDEGDDDGDGDGEGEGEGDDDGDGDDDGEGDGDGDGDREGEVACAISRDGEGDEVTVDIEESLKKNVDQDRIMSYQIAPVVPGKYHANHKICTCINC